MAYNAKSIAELVETLPSPTESKSLGDDAIREIKNVLKKSFPFSPVDDKYEGTLAQLTGLAAGQVLPRDMIVMWAGTQLTEADGPVGWTICDGRARKTGGGNAPDLRGLFVMGAQADNGAELFIPKEGDLGGNHEIDIRDIATGNLHSYTTDGTALTAQNLPSHEHGLFVDGNTTGNSALTETSRVSAKADNVGDSKGYYLQPSTNSTDRGKSSSTGSNTAHTHKFKIDGSSSFTGANIPAYYALIYLIKD